VILVCHWCRHSPMFRPSGESSPVPCIVIRGFTPALYKIQRHYKFGAEQWRSRFRKGGQ
jgi:hypothetical protein